MNNQDTNLKNQNLSNIDDLLFKFVDIEENNRFSSLTGRPRNTFVDILRRFCKNWVALISVFVILFILVTSIVVPLISPFSSTQAAFNGDMGFVTNVPPSYAPIVVEVLDQSSFENLQRLDIGDRNIIKNVITLSGEYRVTYNKYEALAWLSGEYKPVSTILGTSNVGIDIWTRTWAATRDSVVLAILVASTDALIGITLGAFLGFHVGRWIDTIFSRVVDVIINIPTLIWFLMLITIIPVINPLTLYLILISIGWVYMVHQTRLWIITVKDQEFILSAKAIGASKGRQIFVHALPMVVGKLATSYVRRIVVIILAISSLTFLGFLPVTGDPNLGTLLQEARNQVETNVWTLLLPSLILLSFSLSSQFIANGLHDALDPRVGRDK